MRRYGFDRTEAVDSVELGEQCNARRAQGRRLRVVVRRRNGLPNIATPTEPTERYEPTSQSGKTISEVLPHGSHRGE
jgi:hypothetical protein